MLHPDYGTARERTRYRGITWETYETTSQQYLSICKYCFYAIRQDFFVETIKGHELCSTAKCIFHHHTCQWVVILRLSVRFKARTCWGYAGNVLVFSIRCQTCVLNVNTVKTFKSALQKDKINYYERF